MNSLARQIAPALGRLAPAIVLLLMLTSQLVPVSAHGQQKRGAWDVGIAPYVWTASLNGEVGTLPPTRPIDIDASFRDIFKKLDLAAMLYTTVRHNRWGLDFDFFYISLGASASSPGGRISGTVNQSTMFFTPGITYRVFDFPEYFIEVFAGARIWNVDTDLKLVDRNRSVTRSFDETWVDPMIGIQGRINVGASRFYLTGWARVGGFGLGSRVTYEFFGGLGYEIKNWVSAFVGYRHLYVNRRQDDFVFDVYMTGPVVGAVFRFNLGN